MIKKFLLPVSAAAAMLVMAGCEAEATVTVEDNTSSSSTVPGSSTSTPTKDYCKADVTSNGGSIDAFVNGVGSMKIDFAVKGEKVEISTSVQASQSISAAEFDDSCSEAKEDEEAVSVSCDAATKTITVITEESAEDYNAFGMQVALDLVCAGIMGEEPDLPEVDIPVDTTISYEYKYLTYCELYDSETEASGTYGDCEATESKKARNGKPYVDISGIYYTVSGDFDTESAIKIAAYYGDDEEQQEIITDYKYVGFDEDSLGSYWEFESIIDPTDEEDVGDIMRVYGGDFTVVRAKDDSFYWSFSNENNLFKRINKNVKMVTGLKKRH